MVWSLDGFDQPGMPSANYSLDFVSELIDAMETALVEVDNLLNDWVDEKIISTIQILTYFNRIQIGFLQGHLDLAGADNSTGSAMLAEV